MKTNYVTDYAIDESVYTIDSNGKPKKVIIGCIKIFGDEEVHYGVENNNDYYMYILNRDRYRWYESYELAKTRKEARNLQKSVLEKENKSKIKELQEKIRELRDEIE